MSRQALNGISRVIKANTTEKSIDDLRAEGKKRVRVVSSEKVMAIIQAIVDDTISSEVGEITKRDRDRIVSDTQERFSRVLRMQQDLEQDVDDLRGSLQAAELERDRLRSEKSLLETQLDAARRADGADDAVARLARDMTRLKDVVERASRDTPAIDEASIGRMVEKLAARETQSARRLETGLEDLRARLDAAGRDAAASRDAALEKLVQRVNVRQTEAEAQLAARLERELRTVSDRLAEIHGAAGRAPAAEDAVSRLRADFDALENRIHGVEKSSADSAERVAKAVVGRLEQRDAAESDRRGAGAAAEAAQVTESLRRAQRSSDEARECILREVASLRESVHDALTRPVIIQDEQVRDLEQRIAAGASEAAGALAPAVDRLAERTASLAGSLEAMRGEVAAGASEAAGALARAVDRIEERMTSLCGSLQAMRAEVGAVADRTPLADETASQAESAARLDAALGELRAQFEALTARGAEAAERQESAIRALREHVAQNAAVQSGSLESTFKGALDQALDKITRTMERATARPIEMTGEATDVLLAKLFDVPDGEMTSNLDQLDVDQRRSKAPIAKSVGRLKEMSGRAKPAAK